jgi:serine/threonine protein kinase
MASGGSTRKDPASKSEKGEMMVMSRYKINMAKADIMGEGTSSICRKAMDTQTNEIVAVKVYKQGKEGARHEAVKNQKFQRQIQVLKSLQDAFVQPKDATMWNEELTKVAPKDLFMQLLDWSKCAKDGNPGPDPTDNVLYVVTELAQHSLKDFISGLRSRATPLNQHTVKNLTKAIVLVITGLHAKQLVHIDLKPENLMMFKDRLKLIDVDGCVKAGSQVSIHDSSISFSPCYCAPEWAKFLIDNAEPYITVTPTFDVWSTGMTICELVYLDAILKSRYANFLRNGKSSREAGFLFMDWLSNIEKAPLPKAVECFDKGLSDLLVNWLLVPNSQKRKTCAQCLTSPYLASCTSVGNICTLETADKSKGPVEVVHRQRNRKEETSTGKAPIHKGTLWKLNTKDKHGKVGDPMSQADWLKRDMWIAANGSLCYFSIKENKRLVMIDGSKIPKATIAKFEGGFRENAFTIQIPAEDEEPEVKVTFAAESEEENEEWTEKLRSTVNMEDVMHSFKLGGDLLEDLKKFKLTVQNRRCEIKQDEKTQYAPVYKAKLWKLKAEGNKMKDEDWFEREMWLSKNGSLVYFSKKEDKDLVYYRPDDLARAEYKKLDNSTASKPFPFQIQLAGTNDMEFAPGEFAAGSEELRDTWIAEFHKVAQRHK